MARAMRALLGEPVPGEDSVKFSVFSGVLPELSAEQVCARLARHGYDGVEWRVNAEYHWRAATIDRDAPRIKALCAAHGLEVVGPPLPEDV